MVLGPFLKQVTAQAMRNPHVQKAVRSLVANVLSNPQVRQTVNSTRASMRRGIDKMTGRNQKPAGSGAGPNRGGASNTSSSDKSGAGTAKNYFGDFRNFWEKHKTAIGSFIAANFMGIILIMQLGSGVWAALTASSHGHGKKQIKPKKEEPKAVSKPNNDEDASNNGVGKTEVPDRDDGMTFYNITPVETVNTAANPVAQYHAPRDRRDRSRETPRKKARDFEAEEQLQLHDDAEAVADSSAESFASAIGEHGRRMPASPAQSPDNAPLSGSADEIFAFSKANSGAVTSFDNSFHYKMGEAQEGYTRSVESEGVAGRDAREPSHGKRKGSSWLQMFRGSEDPLSRRGGPQSSSGEQTLVFDMRSKES